MKGNLLNAESELGGTEVKKLKKIGSMLVKDGENISVKYTKERPMIFLESSKDGEVQEYFILKDILKIQNAKKNSEL